MSEPKAVIIIDRQPVQADLIAAEKAQQCDLCGIIAELRPYGPKGETVCFKCAMKDEAAAKRAMSKRFGWVDE